jgi:glutamate-5-semialdehyde dehydrogenase
MAKPASSYDTHLRVALRDMAHDARRAYQLLARSSHGERIAALHAMVAAVEGAQEAILAANARDMALAQEKHLAAPLRDRLALSEARLSRMCSGVAEIANQPDALGKTLAAWQVPHNGLRITQISIPLGVIAMIYESRPNVTLDAAALCIASGNAVILRGGSESAHSSQALVKAIREGLRKAGMPENAVQYVPTQDREAVGILLTMTGDIDVIIPRGGASLTSRVASESRVPTLLHLDGNCHSYVHASADLDTAERVVLNAKMRNTSVCGATETLLIDAEIAAEFLPRMVAALTAAGCEMRGDEATRALVPTLPAASESDWATEFLAPVLAIKIVAGVEEAIAHINQYGSHHTDAILARDAGAIARFQTEVDSAIVLVNASTQFADGGEFGFGGEIGIATGRLHARGPVGAAQLTTYKYLVEGEGSTRA